ncbi:restriction endonuclease subunit S, partial [Salmonella enterica subsp. enterica serovar Muenster]|nr:restriction endonuclease subunit S [Salmonella enterica subsp. enterica serovar Muenster]
MNFELTTLGHYVKIQGGYAYKSHDFLDESNNKVLKIKNIRAGYVTYDDCAYISDELASKTKAWSVSEGDVLISMTGSGPNAPQSLVGRVARVWNGDAYLNQRVGRVVLKSNFSIHLDFIYYYLSQNSTQEYFVANSTGSANQANISGKTIEDLPFPIVDFEDSYRISKVLLDLDKKILVNFNINQTLEQMAQALFKSWFIDFEPVKAKIAVLEAGGSQADATLAAMAAISGKDAHALAVFEREHPERYAELKTTAELFPSAMQDSELGEIPVGWMVNSTSEHYSISIGKTPPRKEAQWFSINSEDLKWVSIKDMGIASTYISETSERLTHEAVKKFNIKVMPANTVFLSFKLTVGRVCITTEEMCSNEAIAHFTPKENKYESHWLYHALKSFDFN